MGREITVKVKGQLTGLKQIRKIKAGLNSDDKIVHRGFITIFDSLLVMTSSLEKLAKFFNCESKGMFPLKFLNNISNIILIC